jgi:hypothetical protein
MVAVSAKLGKMLSESRGLQQFANAPHVIRDLGFHCGRNAEAPVNPAKVVEGEPHDDSSPVVLTPPDHIIFDTQQ